MNPINKIKSLFNKQLDIGTDSSRPVQCLISTRDMHVKRITLPARTWYILNDEEKQAYYLDVAGAFPIRQDNDYEYVIDELNGFPWWLSLNETSKCDKIVNQLNALTDDEAIRQRDIQITVVSKDYQSRVVLAILEGVALVIILICILMAIPGILDHWGYQLSWI